MHDFKEIYNFFSINRFFFKQNKDSGEGKALLPDITYSNLTFNYNNVRNSYGFFLIFLPLTRCLVAMLAFQLAERDQRNDSGLELAQRERGSTN